jgi:hypothetical protein
MHNKLMLSLCYFEASKEFIESRRRSLKRFLNIIARHPVLNGDKIFVWFMTTKGSVSVAYQNICPVQCILLCYNNFTLSNEYNEKACFFNRI